MAGVVGQRLLQERTEGADKKMEDREIPRKKIGEGEGGGRHHSITPPLHTLHSRLSTPNSPYAGLPPEPKQTRHMSSLWLRSPTKDFTSPRMAGPRVETPAGAQRRQVSRRCWP